MIAASREAGIVPIVRVPEAEYAFVARVLDQGAQGIIVPRVNTPEQAREIVSWMKYPPAGIRGFASTAAQTDHAAVAADEFIESNHRETLCVIQIERKQSLENLDEMLAVPGIDVACLGCMDLSVDLGIPGQMEHPLMVAAIERVISTAHRHRIASGIISPQLELVVHWMRQGIRFVSYSTEALFLQEAATNAVRRLRSIASAGSTPGESP
jgi:2-dehydro-3-deoxyglucarate aldolase/4-hydroxy-2-oxoheptanedioate aldolase